MSFLPHENFIFLMRIEKAHETFVRSHERMWHVSLLQDAAAYEPARKQYGAQKHLKVCSLHQRYARSSAFHSLHNLDGFHEPLVDCAVRPHARWIEDRREQKLFDGWTEPAVGDGCVVNLF